MTKKFSKMRCAHCLKYCDDLTSDHVFPRSWYPETTPTDIERWQMPSCRACNSRLGKIENELLLKIGMCLPPFDLSSLGIVQKAMRSVNPRHGRDSHDAEQREKRRERLTKGMIDPTTVPLSSIFPGFGFHEGCDPAQERAITVAVDDLKAIATKIIRGTTWVIDQNYIERDYEIEIHFVRDKQLFPFYTPLLKHGKIYTLGPGLTVVRAVANEDGVSGLYYLEFWQRVFMYGSVTRHAEKKEQ